MKKLLLIAAILVCSGVNANAIDTQPELKTVGKWDTIAISSAPAFAVTVASNAYSTLGLRNLDATDNIWCSEDQAVAAANAGAQIRPGEFFSFTLVPGQVYYCKNDSGSGSVNASRFRGR